MYIGWFTRPLLVGVGLAILLARFKINLYAVLQKELKRSFRIVLPGARCVGIYLGARVVDHDQKAGCVEQPRHY
jgi:hypothetical protein